MAANNVRSSQRKRAVFVFVIVILVLCAIASALAIMLNTQKQASTQNPTPPPVTKEVIKEVTPQSVLDKIARLEAENVQLRATPTLSPIIWPKTNMTITSDEARSLLVEAFPNRKVTSVQFGVLRDANQAAVYTKDQFKEIRAKMAPIATSGLSWPSLIDKVIGTFQEPEISDLPVGWAYPPSPTSSLTYLITILDDSGKRKVFGFDPLDKNKIWEITKDAPDNRVEIAIIR